LFTELLYKRSRPIRVAIVLLLYLISELCRTQKHRKKVT